MKRKIKSIINSRPKELQIAEEKLSYLLRTENIKEGSKGIILYRKLIRENIKSILRNAFPLFYRNLNEMEVSKIISMFFSQHLSKEPEFHKISTELLIFIRDNFELSNIDKAILEFEWLLYSIEIDNKINLTPTELDLKKNDFSIIDIKSNPTLKIISLPFQIRFGEPYHEKEKKEHLFLIYRKSDNLVYYKEVDKLNILLLQLISNRDLTSLLNYFSNKNSFNLWLKCNHDDEILHIKTKD